MSGYQMRPGLGGRKVTRSSMTRASKNASQQLSMLSPFPKFKLPTSEDGATKFIRFQRRVKKQHQNFNQSLLMRSKFDKIEGKIEALDDQEDIPLLEIDAKFLEPAKKDPKQLRAVSVTP
jgi:hypothetical protein